MQQPEGYMEGGTERDTVCHLKKLLYGPRLAPKAWQTCLKLELVGFKASDADPGLYIAQYKEGNIYILVYVDDILIAAN